MLAGALLADGAAAAPAAEPLDCDDGDGGDAKEGGEGDGDSVATGQTPATDEAAGGGRRASRRSSAVIRKSLNEKVLAGEATGAGEGVPPASPASVLATWITFSIVALAAGRMGLLFPRYLSLPLITGYLVVGAILFTAGIGAAGLQPGQYQLQATVTRGEERHEERASFVITGDQRHEPAEKPEEVITSSLVAADRIGELTLHALKTLEPARLSVADLLTEVRASGERMYDQIGQYTYSLRKVRRTLNGKGQIRQEEFQDFEAYPVNGRHALIKFSENGTRLAVQLIELNRRVATDLLVKSSHEAPAAAGPARTSQIGYWGASLDGLSQRRGEKRQSRSLTIDPEIFFEACEFTTPRLTVLEGRETIVVDFQPKSGVPLTRDRQWIHRLSGTMWIDRADQALVRIEGLRQPGGSPLVNFVYQQQLLAPGVWAPSLIRVNSGGDESLFDGLNWDAWFEFTQFKRFDTSGIEERIGRQE